MILTLFLTGIALLLLATGIPLLSLLTKRKIIRHASLTCLLVASVLFIFSSAYILYFNIVLQFSVYSIIPQLPFSLYIDRLSSFFILVLSLVSFAVAFYSSSYIEHIPSEGRKNVIVSMMNLFILSMVFVILSETMLSFLFFWELMSLSSFFLVINDYKKDETKKAGLFYFIMMQLCAVFLMIGFFIIYQANGSTIMHSLFEGGSLGQPLFILAFLCLFIGFSIKAGVIPFHKWLPYAHPASPSNISALMSGVMIKVAIYGLVRSIFSVAVPPLWWGVLILIAGSASAILGVIYALKEHDIKRLLAYHSIENIGIILLGIGLSIIFLNNAQPALATLCLIGALFHTLNHALFKSLLFLTAGSMVAQTGTRNIEEMGGLIKKMPSTSLLFLIGSLSISALPPFNGFVSELMIFTGFFNFGVLNNPLLEVLLIISLSIFALTSALAAACFVKAFGITTLALPRSKHAENAKEVSFLMILGPGILAVLCIILGVFSAQIFTVLGYSFPLPDMLIIGLLFIMFYFIIFLVLRYGASQKTRVTETWGCGIPAQKNTMEYTASGFSEPIVTIFKSIYRTKKQSNRSYYDAEQSIFKQGHAEIKLLKVFEEYLYLPIARSVQLLSAKVSKMQNGDPDTYLLYCFLAIIVLFFLIGWVL
jgi:hydrogenase-4 component B